MDGPNKPTVTDGRRIVIKADGPYLVKGGIPLVTKTQVVSEYGEPLTWKKELTLEATGEYALCRCGQSGHKPMCDGTHCEIDFDGTETADTRPGAGRRLAFGRATRIVVEKDPTLCMESGFCGTRDASMPDLVAASSDTKLRSLIIAMVDRCPLGIAHLPHRIR